MNENFLWYKYHRFNFLLSIPLPNNQSEVIDLTEEPPSNLTANLETEDFESAEDSKYDRSVEFELSPDFLKVLLREN